MVLVHTDCFASPALLLRLQSAECKAAIDRFVSSVLRDGRDGRVAARARLDVLIRELGTGAAITASAVVAELAKFAAFWAPNWCDPEAALRAMSNVPEGFDPLVHLPARLAISHGLLSLATLEVVLVAYGVCDEWKRAVLDPKHSLRHAVKAALVVLAYTWHGYSICAPRTVDDVARLHEPYLSEECDRAFSGLLNIGTFRCRCF
jgi:hypothetical protein